MTFEIRTADLWPDVDYELRAAPEGFTFEGYAAVFNSPSVPMRFPGVGGGRTFIERIRPGAFTDSLASNPDVVLLWNHNTAGLPLARTSGGTMTLTEDDRGLRVSATLPDNPHGQVIRDAVKRGDVRGMSFSFGSPQDEWKQEGRTRVRTINKVALGPEVSFASWPAYLNTEAAVRSLAEAMEMGLDEAIELLEQTKEWAPEQQARVKSVLTKREPVIALADLSTLNQKREKLDELSRSAPSSAIRA